MLTLIGIVVFAVIGFRAEKITKKHALWILIVSVCDVFFRTSMAAKRAEITGTSFEWSAGLFVSATLACSAFMALSFLLFAWWGSRRRIKKSLRSNSAVSER